MAETVRQTKRSAKKRLLSIAGSVMSLLAVSSLVVGVTYGKFSSNKPATQSSFATGTVTLTKGATTICTVSNMAPGDSSSGYKPSGSLVGTGLDTQCSITVTYSGRPAYLGLDLGITSIAGTVASPANGLFDGSATGLQLLIKDNQGSPVTYVNGTNYTNKAGSPVTMAYNGGTTNLLVNTSTFTSATVTFYLDYYLPTTSTTGYQGATSAFTLTVHAVQAGNNAATGCTTDRQCPSVGGGFQWQ